MFGIPLPWLLVGLAISLFGTYRGGYHFGWSDRDKEMQIEIAKKNEESRATEHKLNEQLNTTATKLMETTNVVNQKQSALDRAISAGRVRLPSPSCVSAAPSAAAAPGNWTEARAQPDRPADAPSDEEREVLRLIAQITADGDRAINQLNACIDSYNQVMGAINAKR